MKSTLAEAVSRKCPAGSGKDACTGDRCMAWRWAEPMPKRIKMAHGADCSRRQISLLSNTEECAVCGAKAVQIELPEERLGYCGLAGVPLF